RQTLASRNFVVDGRHYRCPLRGALLARLGHNHEFLRATARILQPKGHYATLANPFRARREFFHFVRIEISAALDDDVLSAAGDEDLAVGLKRAVPGIQPGEFTL